MSVDDINVAEFSIEVNKSYLTEEYEANLQAAASALTIKTFLVTLLPYETKNKFITLYI